MNIRRICSQTIISAGLLASATLLTPALHAQDQPAAEKDQAEKGQLVVEGAKEEAKQEPKKICRVETALGSNMPRKVCRTVSSGNDDPENMERMRELRDAREAQQQTQRTGGTAF